MGSCSQNQNIRFWSLKTLERMELIGSEAFITQINEGIDSPQLYIRNLKLADQDLLRQQLSKKTPVLFKIEQSIKDNSSKTSNFKTVNIDTNQYNDMPSPQTHFDNHVDKVSLPDTSESEHYPIELNQLLERAFNLEALRYSPQSWTSTNCSGKRKIIKYARA